MNLLTSNNETIREIVSVAERLNKKDQKILLDNIRLFELKTKAQRVNSSVIKGKKPSLADISSIVRKVRKENARIKA
jgi:hypothetical protein